MAMRNYETGTVLPGVSILLWHNCIPQFSSPLRTFECPRYVSRGRLIVVYRIHAPKPPPHNTMHNTHLHWRWERGISRGRQRGPWADTPSLQDLCNACEHWCCTLKGTGPYVINGQLTYIRCLVCLKQVDITDESEIENTRQSRIAERLATFWQIPNTVTNIKYRCIPY